VCVTLGKFLIPALPHTAFNWVAHHAKIFLFLTIIYLHVSGQPSVTAIRKTDNFVTHPGTQKPLSCQYNVWSNLSLVQHMFNKQGPLTGTGVLIEHIMLQYEAALILEAKCNRQQTNDTVSQTDVFNGIC